MKRYRVLKDFLDRNGNQYLAGDDWRCDPVSEMTSKSFIEILEINNFIKEIPENTRTVDDLKLGDNCYSIKVAEDGVSPFQETWNNSHWMKAARDIGLIYLTKEDCEKDLARLLVGQILRRDARGFKPKFGKKKCIDDYGWEVEFDVDEQELTCLPYRHEDGKIRFATEEEADSSIKAHEKEWKIYLGVEEKKR